MAKGQPRASKSHSGLRWHGKPAPGSTTTARVGPRTGRWALLVVGSRSRCSLSRPRERELRPLFAFERPLFLFWRLRFAFLRPRFAFARPLFWFLRPLIGFARPLFSFWRPLVAFARPLFWFLRPRFDSCAAKSRPRGRGLCAGRGLSVVRGQSGAARGRPENGRRAFSLERVQHLDRV